MIGKLTGLLERLDDNKLLIDVNGVGYVAQCSARTLDKLQGAATATLFIETQVREDAITLIGFATQEEKTAFSVLTTVQGVGARVALSILSTLTPEQLAQGIMSGDKSLLATADGVGPKLAARLVTELKDKATQIGLPNVAHFPKQAGGTLDKNSGIASDAVSTLVNLGFRRDQAFAAVMQTVNDNKDAGFDDVIKIALQELGPKR
jgi:Holliday junction DNA helicase RuvA